MILGNTCVKVSLVPFKTTPPVCIEEGCEQIASVGIEKWDSRGRRETEEPDLYCTGHAHVVFTEWMVGL